jgi:hypothetical protein
MEKTPSPAGNGDVSTGYGYSETHASASGGEGVKKLLTFRNPLNPLTISIKRPIEDMVHRNLFRPRWAVGRSYVVPTMRA